MTNIDKRMAMSVALQLIDRLRECAEMIGDNIIDESYLEAIRHDLIKASLTKELLP